MLKRLKNVLFDKRSKDLITHFKLIFIRLSISLLFLKAIFLAIGSRAILHPYMGEAGKLNYSKVFAQCKIREFMHCITEAVALYSLSPASATGPCICYLTNIIQSVWLNFYIATIIQPGVSLLPVTRQIPNMLTHALKASRATPTKHCYYV